MRIRFLAWDVLKSVLFVLVAAVAYFQLAYHYGNSGRVGFWCLLIGWTIGRIQVTLFDKDEDDS